MDKHRRTPAEKEKFVQSVKALFIPLSLFVATLDLAAGIFMVYSGYSSFERFLGVVFIVVGIGAIVAALIAFIRFQHHTPGPGPQ